MQWSHGPGAGFTTGEPWLPLTADADTRNVAAQRRDPTSMLALHLALLALRRSEPSLAVGTWAPVEATGDILAYTRSHGADTLLVALNLGPTPATLALPGTGVIVLTTGLDRAGESVMRQLAVRGDEGVIVRLDAAAGDHGSR
jgi:alpha-glucosidase